jgi:hypothetical protein
MNRLQLELTRLYAVQTGGGLTRSMVLEVACPAEWQPLAAVSHGLQAELDLPAPAIAVNGSDGLQLWFSLAEPMLADDARAFLDLLRLRYLGELQPHRIRLLLGAPGSVPALQAGNGMWSAFVAPDLAAVMTDEPWLDLPPNPDGQASLLARLHSIQPDALRRATALLQPAAAPASASAQTQAQAQAQAQAATAAEVSDPRAFLLQVMNDRSVALALRIEAAKALLPAMTLQPPPRAGR